MFRRRAISVARHFCVAFVAVALGAAPLLADVSAAADQTEKEDAAPLPEEPADEGLLGSLLKGSDDQSTEDDGLLERVVRGMREAGTRLESNDTGEETRKLQQQVVQSLDELLKAAQQQQQQSQSSASQSPKPQPPGAGQQPKPQQPPQTGAAQPAGEGGGQQTRSDDAAESTERADRGVLREAEIKQRLRLTKDVWGHLPPNLRQQLLNVYSEKHLPQYEELIRAYYEALAEQSRRP